MDIDTLDYHEFERRDDVAWLVLDRPDANQSLSVEMADELHRLTTHAATKDDLRAIVLTSSGEPFCTGADLRTFEGDETDERRLWAIARRLHGAIKQLVTAPKPVVTAVPGVAAGGGFGLALVGDLVYLSEDARLEFAYPRIGLSGDGGASFLLPRLVGLRTAREIALLDEPIDPPDAVELGLATKAVPGDSLEAIVDGIARELASGPTRGFGRFKQLTWDSYGRDFEEQLRAEVEVIARLARTEDFARGIDGFSTGTDPTFIGE